MNIHDKINFRENAICWLRFNQYMQLINNNRLIIAPYYEERLLKQSKIVAENENFKTVYGMYRFEYENR